MMHGFKDGIDNVNKKEDFMTIKLKILVIDAGIQNQNDNDKL